MAKPDKSKEVRMMPVADFLNILRDHPEEYPRQVLAHRAGIDRTTVFRMMAKNPQKRQTPSFDCLESLVKGLGGELVVVFPQSQTRHLPP